MRLVWLSGVVFVGWSVIRFEMGGIKVLTDLKKGERRFSIGMQVLTDLERVSI